jgi:hypothetical protein
VGTSSDVVAEAWVLTTDEGRALLASVASVPSPGPADVARWRKVAPAEKVVAALRLANARRRGTGKFARAERMWLEPTGLEQATSEPVARHKARRFSGRAATVVDLCSGIGGDTLALATGADVLAVDADHGMARRALWNAGVYEVADRVAAIWARAESFGLPRGAWAHIDPDRRAQGSRTRTLRDYQPCPGFLLSLAQSAPGGAIKLGPASDYEDYFGSDLFEVELVSLWGECKEATAWFGEPVTCRRRAICLPVGATWTDRDGPRDWHAPAGPVRDWVFDPDPALVRSGLIDGFAAVHGLTRFAVGVDYLTGPDRVPSPFLAAFEVLAVLPLDLKRLRREVAARGLGPLEIKTRGLDLRPEQVRSQLRPSGDTPGVLILAGGYGPARAVLARRPPT